MMPAWCCSPCALFMSSPSMTSSLLLTGSSGDRMGLSVSEVSDPVGVYFPRTVPPGWYTVTKRLAGLVAVCACALRPWPMISSHGNPIAMVPAPLRTARRCRRNLVMRVSSSLGGPIQEAIGLRHRQQHLLDVVPGRLELRLDRLLVAGVRGVECPAVCELQPVCGEAIVRLFRRGDRLHQIERSSPAADAGYHARGLDRRVVSGAVDDGVFGGAEEADGVEVLEREADRIHELVAGLAHGLRAVNGVALARRLAGVRLGRLDHRQDRRVSRQR